MSAVAEYWEQRAQSFAREGAALRAVCSYGMPAFYNREIDLTQRRALRSHLQHIAGMTLLDIGCGVGRWSGTAARNGARVTGVDVSPTMIEEARRRTKDCDFIVGDVSDLALEQTFDRILAVTVLQHILEHDRFRAAIRGIARHLAPGGRAIVLEAAPTCRNDRCDSEVFRARTSDDYLREFSFAGLQCVEMTGVDPAPFKTWIVPRYRSLPRIARDAALFAVTAASLPLDLLLARRFARWSWHKVFVFER